MEDNKNVIYKCKDNDVEIKIIFNGRKIDELHIGIEGMGDWTVVGYRDLQDALKLARKQTK